MHCFTVAENMNIYNVFPKKALAYHLHSVVDNNITMTGRLDVISGLFA